MKPRVLITKGAGPIDAYPERTSEVDPAAVRIFEALVRAAERVPAR